MKFFCGVIAALLLLAGARSAGARPVPGAWPPVPMWRAPIDWHSPAWHSVKVTPGPDRPEIHFYDKLNPVWWLENADEPAPPDWYRVGEKHRQLKWHFRNPFHNFNFYVLGVVDKKFVRSGHYPEKNGDPHGGWDFELARRWVALLPFISYDRPKITFYFGWRESGAFGVELRLHRPASPIEKKTPKSAS